MVIYVSGTKEDIHEIQDLVKHVLYTCSIIDYPVSALEYVMSMNTEEYLSNDFDEGVYFLLVRNHSNQLIGIGCIDKTKLKRVFIHENYQKQGIGKEIMKRLLEYHNQHFHDEKQMNTQCSIELSATVSAFQLYSQFGFKTYKEIHSLEDGHIYLMRKNCFSI
ncbi:hypothetical protein WA158_008240 [Blastocystis sp. Blastoise]